MVKVLYIQYGNPAAFPPLVHSAGLLNEAGCSIRMVGVVTLNTESMQIEAKDGVSVHLLRYARPGIKQKIQYILFAVSVFRTVLVWRPRWVYASDFFSCPVALIVSYMPGLRLIYHEHDHPGFNLAFFPRLFMRARKYLSGRAAIVIQPNDSRAALFREETGRQGISVWNCPRRREASAVHMPNELTVLYYHGTLNSSRLPTTFLEAVAALKPYVHLKVAGYDTIDNLGYSSLLRKRARELGIEAEFELVGPRGREEVMRSCREADVGIACMPIGTKDPNLRSMVGASNKAFDYMACGLALLVSDLPEWREMYVDPGYARSCNPGDPVSVTVALRWFVENKLLTNRMGELARQRIVSEWNYENQFAPVLQAIAGSCQSSV